MAEKIGKNAPTTPKKAGLKAVIPAEQSASSENDELGFNSPVNADATDKLASISGDSGSYLATVSVNQNDLSAFRAIVSAQRQKTISATVENLLEDFIKSNPKMPLTQIVKINAEKKEANKKYGASCLSAKVDLLTWKNFNDICKDLGIKNSVVIYALIKSYNKRYEKVVSRLADVEELDFDNLIS